MFLLLFFFSEVFTGRNPSHHFHMVTIFILSRSALESGDSQGKKKEIDSDTLWGELCFLDLQLLSRAVFDVDSVLPGVDVFDSSCASLTSL